MKVRFKDAFFATFLSRKVAPKNLKEGKGKHRTLFKVFAQAFFKKLVESWFGAGARPIGDEASAINGKNKDP